MGNSATQESRGSLEKKEPPSCSDVDWRASPFSESDEEKSDGEWIDLPELPQLGYPGGSMALKVCGDSKTGKTSFVERFVDSKFESENPLLFADFKIRTIVMDEQEIRLQMWDNRENRKSRFGIMGSYFRRAHGLFIFYDTTRRDTFDSLPCWIDLAKETAAPGTPMTLIGSKCDLRQDGNDSVDYLTAKKFADENGLQFFEVSMKDGTNVELAVSHMVGRIWKAMVKSKRKPEDSKVQ